MDFKRTCALIVRVTDSALSTVIVTTEPLADAVSPALVAAVTNAVAYDELVQVTSIVVIF